MDYNESISFLLLLRMRTFTCVVLALCLTACSARYVEERTQKIVGGDLTTVEQHPYIVNMMFSFNLVNYVQWCAGTIITSSAILSVTHCYRLDTPQEWRARVGSSFASSGGTVYEIASIILHPEYNHNLYDKDVAVLRTATTILAEPNVASTPIAGSTYNLPDNEPVVAIGWGTTFYLGSKSEQLREVEIWTVNQQTCIERYSHTTVTDNMFCAGYLDVGGKDACGGDSGGPLLHGNVVVGITSWGRRCAEPEYPGVWTKVSMFTSWIQEVAS